MSQIKFGAFDLDCDTGELRRRGRRVKLSPKPLQVLTLLARSPGRLVTREAIRDQLWDSGTFVDFEHALNFCIREVRAALGDNARKPRYIETLPRRGYRFLAQTTNGNGTSAATAPAVNGETIQVEAYGHYMRARASFTQVGKDSLEQARGDFERALALRPDYAMAHSGLGATHALRSLNRRHPEDLDTAESHLRRALQLDAELAEPYPWLCYVLMRKNSPLEALAAGHRGVQLQPDLAHAHYFLGLAYFACCEREPAHYQNAAWRLLDAARTNPHWQPTWFVLSYVALLNGDYPHATEYAERLIGMNLAPKGLPFIGAEIVLATVKLRLSEIPQARALVFSFLDRMSSSNHMYRDSMSAAAACILGDVELRHGSGADALAAYRKAWSLVQEHPRIMAYQRIAARAQAGLAAAYAAVGERRKSEDLLARAIQTTQESESQEHSAAAASLAELYWSLAAGCVRIGDPAQAIEMARRAVQAGWRDAAWMEHDSELNSVRSDAEFVCLVEFVHSAPKPRFVPATEWK